MDILIRTVTPFQGMLMICMIFILYLIKCAIDKLIPKIKYMANKLISKIRYTRNDKSKDCQ